MLLIHRITAKPMAADGAGAAAWACAKQPAAGHGIANPMFGFYGTRVSTGTERPEGRGGSPG